jgi:phage terminase small subunit
MRVAKGNIWKSFRKYIKNINEVKELKKTAILALHMYCGQY